MSNIAKAVIWPQAKDILLRVVFLCVGQGESTIVLAADNNAYRTLLIDINTDSENGGVDVPRLMADLVGHDRDGLGVFVNTHPHNDHLRGITELSTSVDIGEVWHSGHVPGRKHRDAYDELMKVIREVKEAGGKEITLKGSRDPINIGDALCYVLAPAEYVADEIADETEDARYHRIHEQCVVLRIGAGTTWVMLTGDADRDAWEKHITKYHGERLGSDVLSAPHHGSRTFFACEDDGEPYLNALQQIGPAYVVISAPKSSESQWDHPHKEAVRYYAEAVGDDNILHTGERRYSFICDIFRDGKYVIRSDNGELAVAYPTDGDDDSHGRSNRAIRAGTPFMVTRVDHRPMGDRGR